MDRPLCVQQDARRSRGRGRRGFSMRYAIYFTPGQDDPLTRLAASWLGRDPFTGAQPPAPAVTRAFAGRDRLSHGERAPLRLPRDAQGAVQAGGQRDRGRARPGARDLCRRRGADPALTARAGAARRLLGPGAGGTGARSRSFRRRGRQRLRPLPRAAVRRRDQAPQPGSAEPRRSSATFCSGATPTSSNASAST